MITDDGHQPAVARPATSDLRATGGRSRKICVRQVIQGGARGAWALAICRAAGAAMGGGRTRSSCDIGRTTAVPMNVGGAPPAVAANTQGASWDCLAGCRGSPGAEGAADSRTPDCAAWPGQIAIVSVEPRLATGMNPGGTAARITNPGSTSSASRMRTDRSLCRQRFTAAV